MPVKSSSKHVVLQKSAKTPLQTINNPLNDQKLKAMLDDYNSDDYSALSNDEHFFLDEYLMDSPAELHNNVHIQSNTAEVTRIYFNSSEGQSDFSQNQQESKESNPSITPFEFVSGGYKVSKKRGTPSGDAYFVSKLGMGIADGVGGWNAYGIDPAGFSNQLMSECKKLVKRKEFELYHESKEEEVEDGLDEMRRAFGVERRHRKVKRARSSMNMDEFSFDEREDRRTKERLDLSPKSDSTIHDKLDLKSAIVKLEPKSILKDAFKKVTKHGSSTACLCTIHKNYLKVANLGDS